MLRRLVTRVSYAVDRLAPPPPGITILIYHRVGGGSDSAVDLDADAFARQLDHLAEHHRVLSLDQAVDELAAAQPRGWAATTAGDTGSAADDRRPVVITFDDGTEDFADVAVPLLAAAGLPATLYAATRYIDESAEFPWGARPLSWSAVADAAATGLVTVGSHTHDHLLLDRYDGPDLDEDLDRSIELIRAHLGSAPEHFAYPKAVPGSPRAEVAVRRRFRSAALARSRVNRYGQTDLHRLWRTPIQRGDDIEMFAHKAAGGLRAEGELRATAARLRYRRDER